MSHLLNRLFGVELEGYTETNPREIDIQDARIKRDGSLSNTDWTYPFFPYYGLEVASSPMMHIYRALEIWNALKEHGWEIYDTKAGTHIHVNVSDYTVKDTAKLLVFCKKIESIMFSLVKDHRYYNEFCDELDHSWVNFFSLTAGSDNDIFIKANMSNNVNSGHKLLRLISEQNLNNILWNRKYNWINVATNYPTVEFRLYHGISDFSDLERFIKISVSIVNIVKNSTVEQLNFITDAILSESSPENTVGKFCEALGVEVAPIYGRVALRELQIIQDIRKGKESVI